MKRMLFVLSLFVHANFLSAIQDENAAAVIADIYNYTKNSVNYIITDSNNKIRALVKLGKEPYILFPEDSRINIMNKGDILTIHSTRDNKNIYEYFRYSPSGKTPRISLIIKESEAYVIPNGYTHETNTETIF